MLLSGACGLVAIADLEELPRDQIVLPVGLAELRRGDAHAPLTAPRRGKRVRRAYSRAGRGSLPRPGVDRSSLPMMSNRQEAPPPSLHELESLVMEEVWRQGEATVREVLTTLNRGEKQRAYTTVMTIMTRLDAKGLLARHRHGNTDVYRPMLSREDYRGLRAQAEVEALVNEFGDVALAQFATRVSELDAKRLDALRKLAAGE